MGVLLLLAVVTIYLVLGVLYESAVHPLTILSGLPAAGLGALLTLLLFGDELNLYRVSRAHPADRRRQEERHHDDRLRARGAARRAASRAATRSARPACCASVRS